MKRSCNMPGAKLRTVVVLMAVLLHQPTWAQAGPDAALDRFLDAVKAALAEQREDARIAAFAALYSFRDADDDVRAIQRRMVKKLFQNNSVELGGAEPLAKLSEYVADGVRYGPNLPPAGYVVLHVSPTAASPARGLNFTSRVPYGKAEDGRYRFIAMVKRAVAAVPQKDAWITVLVSGYGADGGRLAFAGRCTLRQSDGTDRAIEIGDEGMPSQSVGRRGVGVESCRIEKTAGPGRLRLQLMRDDEKFFDQTFDGAAPAVYPKP